MTLCFDTAAALPKIAAPEWKRIRATPISRAAHARFAAEIAALRVVEVAAPPREAGPVPAARVVAWNAARGGAPDAAAAMLRATGADAFLLTELDVGMARTRQRHTARDLAERLEVGFAYAVEFVELGIGTAQERITFAGRRNLHGFHGAAVASALPLERPALVRLDAGGDWFSGYRGERRIGGRIAVLATIRVAGAPVVLASVHLENYGDPAQRDAQTEALLAALDAYAPGAPALLGGDFNTHSLGEAELDDRKALASAVRADPQRFAKPEPHEPLFARLARAGFARAELGAATHFAGERRGEGGLRLDWLFARGLALRDPEIVPALDPATGAPLSDHEATAVTIAPLG